GLARPRDLRAIRAYAAPRARRRDARRGRSARLDGTTRTARRPAPPSSGARVSLGARSVSRGGLPQGRAATGGVAGTGNGSVHVSSGRVRRRRVIPKIVATPIAPLALPEPRIAPRRVAPDVVAAVLPGPGRDRLAGGEVLVVTTGQQPALFTGPLYTFHKALSAIALAQRLERERGVPVVPVFWVAGDDHDFAEANHAWVLGRDGEPVKITLRERAHDAPQLPLFRESLGSDIGAALDALDAALPDSEGKPDVRQWLAACYRPEMNLADAGAEALNRLLRARGKGLAVFRAHDRAGDRAAAPWLLLALGATLA